MFLLGREGTEDRRRESSRFSSLSHRTTPPRAFLTGAPEHTCLTDEPLSSLMKPWLGKVNREDQA